MRTIIMSLLLISNTNFSITLEGNSPIDLVNKRFETKEIVTIKENHTIEASSSLNREMRKREAGNKWKKVNSLGYMGLYQFGKDALEATGYGHVTAAEFKKNPYIWPPKEQEKAMNKLLKLNAKALNKYIEEYVGDTIKGIVVTKSGLLAAAHLAGAGSIKKQSGVIWFLHTRGKFDPVDAYGTSLSRYLKDFSDLN